MKSYFRKKSRAIKLYARRTVMVCLCVYLAFMMIFSSLPTNRMMIALAEGEDTPVSSADVQQAVEVKHICKVLGFSGAYPGVAYDTVEVEEGTSLASVSKKLPRTLLALLECEGCDNKVEVKWVCPSYNGTAGEYRFNAVLNPERYTYAPIVFDKEKDKHAYDLPYILVKVNGSEISVSSFDAETFESEAGEIVSETDAAVVSGSDSSAVSGSDAAAAISQIAVDMVASASDVGVLLGDEPRDESTSSTDVHSEPCVSGSDRISGVFALEDFDNNDSDDNDKQISYVAELEKPAEYETLPADEDIELVEGFVEKTLPDGRTVTVSGYMPEGTELFVESVSLGYTESLLASNGHDGDVLFAYDIKLIYNGMEYQPRDFGQTVQVSFSGMDGIMSNFYNIVHITEDNTVETMAVEYENGSASFETSSFSYYANQLGKFVSNNTLNIYYISAAGFKYFFTSNSFNNDNRIVSDKGITQLSDTAYTSISSLLNALYSWMDGTGTYYNVNIYLGTEYTATNNETISGKTLSDHGRQLTILHNTDGIGLHVDNSKGTIKLDHVKFSANNHSTEGKGIITVADFVTCQIGDGVEIVGNGSSGSSCRGIFVNGGGNVNVVAGSGDTQKLYIHDCYVSGNGGGICIENPTLPTTTPKDSSISNCKIEKCGASGNGGGVYTESRMTTPLANCEISGCKAANGGGVYTDGTTTITSSSMGGNTATNGGGVFTTGTTTVTGSTLSGNTATGSGGAIYVYDNRCTVDGSTISGNTSGGLYNGDGVMVGAHTDTVIYSGRDPELRLRNTVNITDCVTLTMASDLINGDTVNVDVNCGNPYAVASPIPLSFSGDATIHEVVSVSGDAAAAADVANFYSVDPKYKLVRGAEIGKNAKTIWVASDPVGIVYLDAAGGSDSNDGSTPEKPVRTMAHAYEVLSSYSGTTSGVIYIVNSPYTPSGNVTLTNTSYADGSKTVSLPTNYSLSICRYSKPTGDYSGYGVNTYKGELIKVGSGNSLSISNITIDGHGAAVTSSDEITKNKPYLISPAVTDASKAMVVVDGGKFTAGKSIAFKNAKVSASSNGAAIEAISGEVTVNSGSGAAETCLTFKNCTSTKKGSAIYIAGADVLNKSDAEKPVKVTVGGYISFGSSDIYLADPSAAMHVAAGTTVYKTDASDKLNVGFGTEDADKKAGRILIHYDESGHTVSSTEYAKYIIENSAADVANKKVVIEYKGQNIRIKNQEITFTLTAYPEDLETSLDKSYSVDLTSSDTFDLKLADIKGKTIAISDLNAEKVNENTFSSLSLYTEVEANKYKLGIAASDKTFGISMDYGSSSVNVASGASYTVPSDATSTTLTFTVHNANNISSDYNGEKHAAKVTFKLAVGSETRDVTVYIDTAGCTALSCIVPLKMAYVIDIMDDEAITPNDYYIENTCVRPIVVKSVNFKWNSTVAGEVFALPTALVTTTESFGSKITFNGLGNTDETVDKLVEGSNSHKKQLPIKWNISLGDNNFIKSRRDREGAAEVIYTLGIAE